MSGWVAGAIGVSAVASLGSAAIGANASKQAANQYADSATQGLNYQKQVYNDITGTTAPYRGLGIQGLNTLGSMMQGQYQQYDQNGNPIGMANGSGYLTAQPTMNDLTSLMPNYKFGLDQGMGQFNSQMNAGGGAISGNAIQGAQQFAQDYAGNQLQNAFNNFQTNRQNVAQNALNVANIGSQNVATQANAGTNAASNVSNTYSNIGNAQAQGTMGAANAWSSGLNNISNYAMLYGMMKK